MAAIQNGAHAAAAANQVTDRHRPTADPVDEIWTDLVEFLAGFEPKDKDGTGTARGYDIEKRVRLVHNQAGRGLVAREDVPPDTLLISIPGAALLNVNTLRPLYPPGSSSTAPSLSAVLPSSLKRTNSKLDGGATTTTTTTGRQTAGRSKKSVFEEHLNATQWLSLHLACQFRKHLGGSDERRQEPRLASSSPRSSSTSRASRTVVAPSSSSSFSSSSPRDLYWPFIASLPRAFPTVPLSWTIARESIDQLATRYSVRSDDPSIVSMTAAAAAAVERDATLSTGDASGGTVGREGKEDEGRGGEIGDEKRRERTRRRRMGEVRDSVSRGVRKRVEDVEKRFSDDWTVVREFWKTHHLADEDFGFFDFVLAWINCNTRCIYLDVNSHRKEDNLTLAPVIDMINHFPSLETKPTPTSSSKLPGAVRGSSSSSSSSSPGTLTGLTFSSPARSSSDPRLRRDAELGFSYGGHDDAMLLAEYGFVIGSGENPYNSVDVDRYVEALFDAQGEEGEWKKGVLNDEGYWGDMTFQSNPPSASWRVLTSLRLLHLRLSPPFLTSSPVLNPLYSVLSGESDVISPLNETKVQRTVGAIADSVRTECLDGLKRIEAIRARWRAEEGDKVLVDQDEWDSLAMVEKVWRGELEIAEGVRQDSSGQ
ncbi:hypothetical protein JCM10212_000347 [Sporobolomyces blumeae]